MADRSTFRIAFAPFFERRSALPWFEAIRDLGQKSSAKSALQLGATIARLDGGNELAAFQMYQGEFQFAGETVTTTTPYLFSQPLGSEQWQAALHSLNWLKDFTASHRKLHAHFALRLLGRWAKSSTKRQSLSTLCSAVEALALDGVALAKQVEIPLQKEFLQLAKDKILNLNRNSSRSPVEAVDKAITLLQAATCFKGLENLQGDAGNLLVQHIDKVVLSDGGYISKSPEKLIRLLARLMPLQQKSVGFPLKIAEIMVRMLAMLKMLAHTDGTIAGLDPQAPETALACLLLKNLTHQPPSLALESRIARLAQSKSCLIAHLDGNQEFEFASGTTRLFKNYTEEFWGDKSEVNLTDSPDGQILQIEISQNRNRTYFLNSSGTDLRVEDLYADNLEIVFEINPALKLMGLRDSNDILLITPDKSVWKLSTRGAEARIEKNGAIIRLMSTGQSRINWALKKQIKSAKSTAGKPDSMPDLLS
jgi:uncharacterized heparinase superfamily protein